MNASDELLHEQLHHLVRQGRKAVVADMAILVVKGYDEEVKANASMVVFSLKGDDEKSEQEIAQEIILGLGQAMEILVSCSDMEVILRDKKTGTEFRPGEKVFGHRVKQA